MDRGVRLQGHRLIRAGRDRLWQVLSRLEAHPRYAGIWMAADLLERSQSTALVELHGFFGGLPVSSLQRFHLRPPGRIEFRQVRGTLRDLSGAYILGEVDGETDLTLTLTVDAGIPLFSEDSVRQILAGHIAATLAKIKATVERDLARVVVRRGVAPEAEAPSAAEAPVDLARPDASPSPEGAPPERPAQSRRRKRRRRRGRPT